MAASAARLRQMYPFLPPSSSVDQLIIGGGEVGLSVAAALVESAGKDRTTFLVDRKHDLLSAIPEGSSEDISSGIYYPPGSTSSRFCIRGRQMLFDRCERLGLPYRKTEKLIVATQNAQVPYLDHLQTITTHESLIDPSLPSSPYVSNSLIPTYFLSPAEAVRLEPDLGKIVGALLVRESGIVDLRALRQSLLGDFERQIDGQTYRNMRMFLAGRRVVRIDPLENGDLDGWVVQLERDWGREKEGNHAKGTVESVKVRVVVNTAGPGGVGMMAGTGDIDDMGRRIRRTYLSYDGPGLNSASRLIHTAPGEGVDHLGSRLSRYLDRRIHFGPIITPVQLTTNDFSDDAIAGHHSISDNQIKAIGSTVKSYFPDFDSDHLRPIQSSESELSPANDEIYINAHPDNHHGGRMFLDVSGGWAGATAALSLGEEISSIVERDTWQDKTGKKKGMGWLQKIAEGWGR